MRSSTRLDSALFQLTPTRTRCDLVISANGKTEKIASGLLQPFLSHLKTAQEQMAKGGYSIILEPESGSDAAWFTKSTVERFVRFVSTPEVLERVYTLESEILQIEEAIAIQGNHDMGYNAVEDNHGKPLESIEGSKPILDSNEEKAIVLYEAGARKPETNGTAAQGENSKVELLKVLETRKKMLQKEQGMAFARAVAAGFDFDHLPPLISFAECFGASRLMDACRRYKELWKQKHETGQWLEIEAAEAMSNRVDFSATNASGIVLSSTENNEKVASADEKPSLEHQPSLGHQEYSPGQFPNQMFPPWPVHSPGSLPGYPQYPMQGMPYYQNYPGPYYQPPYPMVVDPRLDQSQKRKHRRHSLDGSLDNDESEAWELDASRTRSSDDTELDRESRKKSSRSGKKKSGTVVIRNINYISSKGKHSSDGEYQSGSDSQTEEEDGNMLDEVMNSLKSNTRKGNHKQSIDISNSSEKEANGDNWQAFQSFLLRDADEDDRSADHSMFAMENKAHSKRRQSNHGADPLLSDNRRRGESQDGSTMDVNELSATRMRKSSNGELLMSVREGQLDNRRNLNGQLDLHAEIDGRRVGYRSISNDEFMIHGQHNQSGFKGSPSDPLAVNGFERVTRSLDKRLSHNMNDDSYIVPFRSMSLDHVESSERNAIDMDSEFPSEDTSHKIAGQVNYEPDEMSLLPQRGTEKGSTSYDPARDYEMQLHINSRASLDNRSKDVVSDVKGTKKPEKDRNSKIVQNTAQRKIGGPIRKGKPSKLSPLEEARARAEKLRSFKADLQKIKKEKEEEEVKRLEALKVRRQKRIAARGGSIPAQSSLPSQPTRKQGLTKLSPAHKGSKFSDSEPGSSSPLQRFPIKSTSMGGSVDSQKTSKSSKLNPESQSVGNRLTRSVSSLPEKKKDNTGISSETKPSMARIRRLSEPKMPKSTPISSVKPRSTVSISKPKASDGSENKKISAIVNYDKSKAASLPELKIRTSKGPAVAQSTSSMKETSRKDISVNPTSGGVQLKRNLDESTHHSDKDNNPVIEKTVMMLEKPSVPIGHAPEINLEVGKGQHDWDKTKVVSDYAAIRAPVSPHTGDVVDNEHSHELLQQPLQSNEALADNTEKETPKFFTTTTNEKPYQAPYVRQSSLEDPCTVNSEYGKAISTSSEIMPTCTATVKPYVFESSESSNSKLEKIPEVVEKSPVKESSKGFRRLLKFGRKNHSSSAGEPDNGGMNGSEADNNGSNTGSSSEVNTLKNLISQDETPNSSATTKGSRHFSLLSPFRSKTEKKPTT